MIQCHVFHKKSTNILKEHIISIFSAEEQVKEEINVKQVASTADGATSPHFQRVTWHYIPADRTLLFYIRPTRKDD